MTPSARHTRSEALSRALKRRARDLGFDACGIARATRLDEEAERLEAWLLGGRHAGMEWMTNHFEKRVDPRQLVEGARSVVCVLHNYYYPADAPAREVAGKISRYARGDDYHRVMKEKLYELFEWLGKEAGGVEGRAFVDSAPVLEKAWAARSGLGWIGKHANLINRSLGSYFFIGELIVDTPLACDSPAEDFCGSCTRCIDACPTDAIYRPYAVDANRCISYWTIEHRGDDVPTALQSGFENWIFGCDICQEACPWNKFKKPSREERYAPRAGMVDTDLATWEEIDLEEFRRRFRRNPVRRAKFDGFKRNVRIARRNAQDRAG